MLPEELEEVFGSVAQLYSRSLADGFRRLQPQVQLCLSWAGLTRKGPK